MKNLGLYDTFVLKIPIQCNKCYTGAHYNFQTKEGNCLLDEFVEGKPAVSYYLRGETPEEFEEKMREYRETDPEWADSPLAQLGGMFRRSDDVIPGSQLRDGGYEVYTFCDECDELFFVTMVVKDGIFVGVEK